MTDAMTSKMYTGNFHPYSRPASWNVYHQVQSSLVCALADRVHKVRYHLCQNLLGYPVMVYHGPTQLRRPT